MTIFLLFSVGFRWKTVEFESAIEGKMAKIAQLQRSLAVKDEVGRLQQQVHPSD